MFQEALIESLPHRTRRVGTVLASASVHALALGALAWISLQAIGEIEDPPEALIYRVGLIPPALGEGGPSDVSKVRPPLPSLPQAAVHPTQIQTTHDTTPDDRSTSESKELSTAKTPGAGEREVGPGGDPQGIPGGTSKTPLSMVGPNDDTFPITRVDRPPVLLTRVEPVYPEAARKSHLSGTVVLQAVINAAGRVEDLRIMKSAGQLLDAAAISAVEKWIYRPATLDARAVKVYLTVTVDFALH